MQPPDQDGRVVIAGWPDRAVGWIAGGQRTLVTHGQLRGLGISDSAIARAVARGRLHRVHRGVHSLVAASLRPPFATELAAILAHGEGAVLSHATAARVHDIVRLEPDTVHVTIAGVERRSVRAGITLHRTVVLDPAERHRVSGLPVTSVARTVIDLFFDPECVAA